MHIAKSTFALLATLLVAAHPALAADDPNKGAIKARQGYFSMVKFNAGPLFGMAKGEMDYNPELARHLATNLSQLGGVNTARMWRKGSSVEQYKETEALPEIWAKPDEFRKREQALKDAIAALAPAAGDGLDALRGGVKGLGKACKGCHDNFRAE